MTNKIFTFLIFSFLTQFAISQEDIAVEEIEWAVLEVINDLRKAEGLDLLKREEVLDAVAFNQSEYIAETSKLSHEQEDSKKKTLVDRILFFEAPFAFAGENIALFSSNSKYTLGEGQSKQLLSSPEQVAKAAIYSWQDEEDSKLNLFDPNFSSIGISVLLNEKKQYSVVAVISNPAYNLAMPKKAFSFEGIDAYNKESCSKLDKDFPNIEELLSTAFQVEGDKLYFVYPSLDLFNELISSSSDGLSAEIIFNEQFLCSEGNRLFPGNVTDGYLLPLSKKAKLNTSNTLVEQKEVKIELATLPEFFDSKNCEINGLVIKDGKKCSTIPYNKIEFKDLKSLDIPLQFIGESLNDSTNWKDTLVLQFPTSLPESEKLELLKGYKSLVESVSFNASRVDVQIIVSPTSEDLLTEELDSGFYSFLRNENTDLALGSIVSDDYLLDRIKNTYHELEVANLDSTEKWSFLREAAKEDEKLKDIIDSINQIKIIAYGTASISSELTKEEKMHLLNKSIKSDNTQLAIILQRSLLEEAIDNGASLPNYSMDTKQNKTKLPLLNNEIVYANLKGEETYDGNPIHIAFLELYLINPSQKIITYNYLLSTLNYWGKSNKNIKGIDEWQKQLAKVVTTNEIKPSHLAKTELFYNLLAADYYYEKADFGKRKKALSAILDLQKKANLSEEEIIEIAKYFALQDQFSMAVDLMKSRLSSDSLSADYLSYFLQISFYDESNFSKENYLKTLERLSELSAKEFCEFFSKNKRGIQPLKDNAIKEIYCSICTE